MMKNHMTVIQQDGALLSEWFDTDLVVRYRYEIQRAGVRQPFCLCTEAHVRKELIQKIVF